MIVRRRRVLSVLGLGLLVVVAVLAVDALRVRSDVRDARAQLTLLDTGIRSGTPVAQQQAQLSAFAAAVTSARRHTHGPLWSAVSHLPLLGRPLATARDLTDVTQGLQQQSLPSLVDAASALEPLRAGAAGGVLPLAPLVRAAPSLTTADTGLATAQRRAEAVRGSWLGPVAHARDTLVTEIVTLHQDTTIAAAAARLAPGMLGAAGPRTYFVAFLNPAEIRGGGGVLGGYALLTADHGRIAISRIGGEQDLPQLTTPPAGLDAEWLANFQDGFHPATVWQNTNLTPDFPSAAAAWAAMYATDFHVHVDGVVSIDADTLATLLRYSGPATVDGQTVSAANAVEFLESGEYRLPLTVPERKGLLGQVGQQVFQRLIGGQVAGQALFTDLAGDAGSGHLHVYASRPAEESALASFPVAGVLPVTPAPYFAAAVADAGGEKLSQYVSERVTYTVASCTGPIRQVRATVALINHAPTTALPAYATTRLDHPEYAVARNQVRMILTTYLTAGTKFGSATLDGRDVPLLAADDELSGDANAFQTSVNKGHPTLLAFVELPPGATRTFSFVLGEPASAARPTLPLQALPQPPTATFLPSSCVG